MDTKSVFILILRDVFLPFMSLFSAKKYNLTENIFIFIQKAVQRLEMYILFDF